MQTIILATHSRYKVQEFQALMPNYQIVPMGEIGYKDDILEPGKTFAENALIKARTIKEYLNTRRDPGYIVVAEDSGLCVDALGGRPGIYTARYGGTDCSGHDQRMTLLGELEGITNRAARFECFIACFLPSGALFTTTGITLGTISYTERGENGFAFDQIFVSDELGKTFGEVTPAEKNRVSHRARAIAQLRAYLKDVELE